MKERRLESGFESNESKLRDLALEIREIYFSKEGEKADKLAANYDEFTDLLKAKNADVGDSTPFSNFSEREFSDLKIAAFLERQKIIDGINEGVFDFNLPKTKYGDFLPKFQDMGESYLNSLLNFLVRDGFLPLSEIKKRADLNLDYLLDDDFLETWSAYDPGIEKIRIPFKGRVFTLYKFVPAIKNNKVETGCLITSAIRNSFVPPFKIDVRSRFDFPDKMEAYGSYYINEEEVSKFMEIYKLDGFCKNKNLAEFICQLDNENWEKIALRVCISHSKKPFSIWKNEIYFHRELVINALKNFSDLEKSKKEAKSLYEKKDPNWITLDFAADYLGFNKVEDAEAFLKSKKIEMKPLQTNDLRSDLESTFLLKRNDLEEFLSERLLIIESEYQSKLEEGLVSRDEALLMVTRWGSKNLPATAKNGFLHPIATFKTEADKIIAEILYDPIELALWSASVSTISKEQTLENFAFHSGYLPVCSFPRENNGLYTQYSLITGNNPAYLREQIVRKGGSFKKLCFTKDRNSGILVMESEEDLPEAAEGDVLAWDLKKYFNPLSVEKALEKFKYPECSLVFAKLSEDNYSLVPRIDESIYEEVLFCLSEQKLSGEEVKIFLEKMLDSRSILQLANQLGVNMTTEFLFTKYPALRHQEKKMASLLKGQLGEVQSQIGEVITKFLPLDSIMPGSAEREVIYASLRDYYYKCLQNTKDENEVWSVLLDSFANANSDVEKSLIEDVIKCLLIATYLPKPDSLKINPDRHQNLTAMEAIKTRKFFVGDYMGTGKTLSAILTVELAADFNKFLLENGFLESNSEEVLQSSKIKIAATKFLLAIENKQLKSLEAEDFFYLALEEVVKAGSLKFLQSPPKAFLVGPSEMMKTMKERLSADESGYFNEDVATSFLKRGEKFLDLENLLAAKYIVSTYAYLGRNEEFNAGKVERVLAALPNIVIFDEVHKASSFFSNREEIKVSQPVEVLLEACLRAESVRNGCSLFLSGTPKPHEADDLASLIMCLRSDNLFRESFFDRNWSFIKKDLKEMNKKLSRELMSSTPEWIRNQLRARMVRFKTEDVLEDGQMNNLQFFGLNADDLSLDYESLPFMTSEESEVYNEKIAVLGLSAAKKRELLLRSCIAGPYYGNPEYEGEWSKFEALISALKEDLEQSNVVIFYAHFRKMITERLKDGHHDHIPCLREKIEERMKEFFTDFNLITLNGGLPEEVRNKKLADFAKKKRSVLLAFGDVAGTGIDLTSANIAYVWTAPWWFYDISQWIARVYRRSQEKDVKVRFFIQPGTYEESIYNHGRQKALFTERIFGDGKLAASSEEFEFHSEVLTKLPSLVELGTLTKRSAFILLSSRLYALKDDVYAVAMEEFGLTLAEGYNQDWESSENADTARVLRYVLKNAESLKPGVLRNVLDVGAGPLIMQRTLCDLEGVNVSSLDANPYMLDLGYKLLPANLKQDLVFKNGKTGELKSVLPDIFRDKKKQKLIGFGNKLQNTDEKKPESMTILHFDNEKISASMLDLKNYVINKEAEKFSTVCCSYALYYLNHDRKNAEESQRLKFIYEVSRILEENGLFVLATPETMLTENRFKSLQEAFAQIGFELQQNSSGKVTAEYNPQRDYSSWLLTFKKVRGFNSFEEFCENLRNFDLNKFDFEAKKTSSSQNEREKRLVIGDEKNLTKNTTFRINDVQFEEFLPWEEESAERNNVAELPDKKEIARNNFLAELKVKYADDSLKESLFKEMISQLVHPMRIKMQKLGIELKKGAENWDFVKK